MNDLTATPPDSPRPDLQKEETPEWVRWTLWLAILVFGLSVGMNLLLSGLSLLTIVLMVALVLLLVRVGRIDPADEKLSDEAARAWNRLRDGKSVEVAHADGTSMTDAEALLHLQSIRDEVDPMSHGGGALSMGAVALISALVIGQEALGLLRAGQSVLVPLVFGGIGVTLWGGMVWWFGRPTRDALKLLEAQYDELIRRGNADLSDQGALSDESQPPPSS